MTFEHPPTVTGGGKIHCAAKNIAGRFDLPRPPKILIRLDAGVPELLRERARQCGFS
jgi:hypothetical protein